MKTIVWLSLFLVPALSLNAQHHFRDSRWGMTAAQVRAVEKAQFNSRDAAGLYYDIELFDTRCRLSYLFKEDRLFRAGYVTVEYYMNEAMYFDTYGKFRDSLTAKYGQPREEVKNVPAAYEDDMGTGLTLGKVFWHASWDLGDVDLLLSVSGGDGGQHVMAVYTKKEPNAGDE